MNVQKVTVKYGGEPYEFDVSELDMSPVNPSDQEVRDAIIGALSHRHGITVANLNEFVVVPPQDERNAGEHDAKTVLNLMPDATYG